MIEYLIFGAGFYIGLTSNNPRGFVDASAAAILRGLLLGFIFWPVGLIVQIYLAMES